MSSPALTIALAAQALAVAATAPQNDTAAATVHDADDDRAASYAEPRALWLAREIASVAVTQGLDAYRLWEATQDALVGILDSDSDDPPHYISPPAESAALVAAQRPALVAALVAEAGAFQPDPDDEDEEGGWLEVRLQLFEGRPLLYFGDPQGDADHRGAWGASAIRAGASPEDAARVLDDLAEQALDMSAEAWSGLVVEVQPPSWQMVAARLPSHWIQVTCADPGFSGRRAKWRIASAPYSAAPDADSARRVLSLDGRSAEAKRAGLRIAYERGGRAEAVSAATATLGIRRSVEI